MKKILILLNAITSITVLLALPPHKDSSLQFNSEKKPDHVPIHKQYFFHSGPEPPLDRKVTFGRSKKNFRVVFLNIPSGYEKLRQSGRKPLEVSFAPVEEKLAIYVLNPKKNSQEVEVVNYDATPPTASTPPEVHFVKYRDDQDIAEVQTSIKDHYLALD